MTTFENVSLSQIAIHRLGKAIARRKEAKEAMSNVANRAHTWIQATIRFVLQVAGLSSLTYAGFVWSTIAGLVVAGVSFFVLSWLITPTQVAPRPTVDPMANRR